MNGDGPRLKRQISELQGFKDGHCSSRPPPAPGNVDFFVLGSGVSTAVPIMSHVLRASCPNPHVAVRKCDGRTVCEEAHSNPDSKNRRFNVSLLVRYTPADGGDTVHIMIDAGKTMRQAVLALFPSLGISSINALLLTHGHADALLGMDDLRDLQYQQSVWEDDDFIGYQPVGGAMRIVSNKATLDTVRQVFPYLCGTPEFAKPGVLLRRIALIEVEEVDDNSLIEIGGLPVKVFPVWHGGTYVSLGFAFGQKVQPPSEGVTDGSTECGYSVVYISDVKAFPPETMAWLERIAEMGIDLLAVDALGRNLHTTHFCLDEALDFVRSLRPKETVLVGMSSCGIGDHDQVNAELALLQESEGLDVKLAYDGMKWPEFAART